MNLENEEPKKMKDLLTSQIDDSLAACIVTKSGTVTVMFGEVGCFSLDANDASLILKTIGKIMAGNAG